MSEPIQLPTERMTLAEFYAWAERQPEGRYEPQHGPVVAMAPMWRGMSRPSPQAWSALRNAIRAAGLPCVADGDGLAVEVADGRAYPPDALVKCGERLPGSALVASNPVIVVEVGSPSTSRVDSTGNSRPACATPRCGTTSFSMRRSGSPSTTRGRRTAPSCRASSAPVPSPSTRRA